jgi:hypothetical protein
VEIGYVYDEVMQQIEKIGKVEKKVTQRLGRRSRGLTGTNKNKKLELPPDSGQRECGVNSIRKGEPSHGQA